MTVKTNASKRIKAFQDPALQKWPKVPKTGWAADSPEGVFTVLANLDKHLASRKDDEGRQLLARLWRANNPMLKKISEM